MGTKMKKQTLWMPAIIAFFGVLVFTSCSEIEKMDKEVDEMHLNNLKNWVVNGSTSEKAIAQFGYENCFTILPIQDYYWKDYQNSQHEGTATVNRSDLMSVRLLVYCGTSMSPLKTGEIICNKSIANDLAVKLFKQHGFTWGGDSADGKRYYFEKKE